MVFLRSHFHGGTGKYFISVCKNITGCPRSTGLCARFCWMYNQSPLYFPGLGFVVKMTGA